MHIPDGFLDPEVAGATAVLAAGSVAYALRRAEHELDDRAVPLLGVTGSFIFAAQMLNFPVAGGTSGHLLGATLAAVLLGPWLACVVMAVVITGQALLFADGGVSALGANVLNMGVLGAVLAGALVGALQRVLPRGRRGFLAAVAVSAWTSVVLGALATSAELALAGTVPLATALVPMLAVHVVIGVGEAVVTTAAVGAVLTGRADLIRVPVPRVAVR